MISPKVFLESLSGLAKSTRRWSLPTLAAVALSAGNLATGHAETLYVSSHSGTSWVGAYDAKTGSTIKVKFIKSGPAPRGLAVTGKRLYVAGLGAVSLYNATTGKLIKYKFLDEDALGLLLSGDRLYAGMDGAVRCFEAATGKPIAGFVPVKIKPMAGYSSSPGLAVSDNRLYAVNGDHSVGVYDATTGAVINAALVTGLDFPYNVAVSGNRLFATSGQAVVECDARTGKVVNASYISGLDAGGGLCIAGSHLYATGDPRKSVVEYDLTTNKPVPAFHGVAGTIIPSYLAVSGNHADAAPVKNPRR